MSDKNVYESGTGNRTTQNNKTRTERVKRKHTRLQKGLKENKHG